MFISLTEQVAKVTRFLDMLLNLLTPKLTGTNYLCIFITQLY